MFISYAHESDQLRAAVKDLADWLESTGCEVLTDHRYVNRPPKEGWQAWMLGCIDRAETVLIVCTPKLRARYEKTAAPDSGRGATYEGAIVTQHIYDNAMRNDKFFPVLPDDGDLDNVPTALRSWESGHRFPSGNQRIRDLIFGVMVGSTARVGTDPHASSSPAFALPQERLAWQRLSVPEAGAFLRSMLEEFARRFPGTTTPHDATSSVRWFTQCAPADVQKLFFLVRTALREQAGSTDAQRKASEHAAVPLYCLAALRLVDQAVAHASAVQSVRHLIYTPSSENVVCAIIATALFGGELHLLPAEGTRTPRPEHVFEVKVPAAGDQTTEAFERAAYAAVFQNDSDVPDISLETGPLSPAQRARLAARIDDIKDRQSVFALVVHGLTRADAAAKLATDHQFPVLLPSTDLTTKLLAMDADRLKAEIDLLWALLFAAAKQTSSTPTVSTPHATSPAAPGAITVQVTGNAYVAHSSGHMATAQAGSGNVATLNQTQTQALTDLAPLLRQLVEAISAVPSAKARDALAPLGQSTQDEISKKDPNPGLIKRALEAIKTTGDAIEGGEKIVALASRAYQLLSTAFNFPSPPFP